MFLLSAADRARGRLAAEDRKDFGTAADLPGERTPIPLPVMSA